MGDVAEGADDCPPVVDAEDTFVDPCAARACSSDIPLPSSQAAAKAFSPREARAVATIRSYLAYSIGHMGVPILSLSASALPQSCAAHVASPCAAATSPNASK